MPPDTAPVIDPAVLLPPDVPAPRRTVIPAWAYALALLLAAGMIYVTLAALTREEPV